MLVVVHYQLRRLRTDRQTDRQADRQNQSYRICVCFRGLKSVCCGEAHLRVEDGTKTQTCCFVTQQLQEQQNTVSQEQTNCDWLKYQVKVHLGQLRNAGDVRQLRQ